MPGELDDSLGSVKVVHFPSHLQFRPQLGWARVNLVNFNHGVQIRGQAGKGRQVQRLCAVNEFVLE
jgi:hypothetical protein